MKCLTLAATAWLHALQSALHLKATAASEKWLSCTGDSLLLSSWQQSMPVCREYQHVGSFSHVFSKASALNMTSDWGHVCFACPLWNDQEAQEPIQRVFRSCTLYQVCLVRYKQKLFVVKETGGSQGPEHSVSQYQMPPYMEPFMMTWAIWKRQS